MTPEDRERNRLQGWAAWYVLLVFLVVFIVLDLTGAAHVPELLFWFVYVVFAAGIVFLPGPRPSALAAWRRPEGRTADGHRRGKWRNCAGPDRCDGSCRLR